MTRARSSVLTALTALTVLTALAAVLPAASSAGAVPPTTAPSDGWPTWAGVLVAGDASIDAFDNGIDAVGAELAQRGVTVVATPRVSDGTATRAGLAAAMADLAATDADGCLVYLTSHGNEVGLLLSLEGDDLLRPDELDALVDAGCGDRPTAVVVSACHSGTFVPELSAANRVVITAARTERSSFGCSADAVYTFFDECVLGALPVVDSWEQLYAQARACVERRESELGYVPSEPQLSVGAGMVNAALPESWLTWTKGQQVHSTG